MTEGVVADSAQLAKVMQGRESAPHRALPDPSAPGDDTAVVGWQEVVLNQNGVCEQCNEILARGERAAVGVPVRPRPIMLCLPCLATLVAADDDQPNTAAQTRSSTTRKTKPTGHRNQDTN